jgi:hypothetical protein
MLVPATSFTLFIYERRQWFISLSNFKNFPNSRIILFWHIELVLRAYIVMNEYQLEHKTTYHSLVASFKPAARKASDRASIGATLDIRDTVIGVRIRPILPNEDAAGHVPGVCSRVDGAPIVDIHEFRPHVRSKPRLDVNFIRTLEK